MIECAELVDDYVLIVVIYAYLSMDQQSRQKRWLQGVQSSIK